jgi:hypothetical protein
LRENSLAVARGDGVNGGACFALALHRFRRVIFRDPHVKTTYLGI